MLTISLTIACSRYTYDDVILHAHPVCGESRNQRNTTGEVATIATSRRNEAQCFLSAYLHNLHNQSNET